jgi:hypothetical protein
MAGEEHQDPDVEEVAAEAQLLALQELRGVGLPGVLLAIEADEAAEEKHAERDVGVDAEEELL